MQSWLEQEANAPYRQDQTHKKFSLGFFGFPLLWYLESEQI